MIKPVRIMCLTVRIAKKIWTFHHLCLQNVQSLERLADSWKFSAHKRHSWKPILKGQDSQAYRQHCIKTDMFQQRGRLYGIKKTLKNPLIFAFITASYNSTNAKKKKHALYIIYRSCMHLSRKTSHISTWQNWNTFSLSYSSITPQNLQSGPVNPVTHLRYTSTKTGKHFASKVYSSIISSSPKSVNSVLWWNTVANIYLSTISLLIGSQTQRRFSLNTE